MTAKLSKKIGSDKKDSRGKKCSIPASTTTVPESPRTPNKKVVHQIFAECSELTLDPYWQHLFDECARGKFPRGSGIDSSGTVVYFRVPTKSYVSYKLKENPAEVFTDLKHLFQEQLGYKSQRDRQVIRDEIDDLCNDLRDTYNGVWQQIKRKKIKDPIIRRYILELKNMYSLDDLETSEVAQIIKLGFLFNWIGNEHVVYEDQKITDIKSLHFDDEDRSFDLDEPATQYKREYKPKIAKLSALWQKHLLKPKNSYLL